MEDVDSRVERIVLRTTIRVFFRLCFVLISDFFCFVKIFGFCLFKDWWDSVCRNISCWRRRKLYFFMGKKHREELLSFIYKFNYRARLITFRLAEHSVSNEFSNWMNHVQCSVIRNSMPEKRQFFTYTDIWKPHHKRASMLLSMHIWNEMITIF